MERILFDVAIKGALLLGVTALLARGLGRRPAAQLHLVWALGLAAGVALPALGWILPHWRLPLLPAVEPALGAAGAAVPARSWPGVVVAVWAAGAFLVLATTVVARVRVAWLARGATPVATGRIAAQATLLCGALDLPRRVEIRTSERAMMPMIWGVVRPVVLLPAEAERWSDALLRDVLLHELAHVKRHDVPTQLLARFACALHWFDPLAWIAARAMRHERERACDDQVLQAGADPYDYAAHLLAIARRLSAPRAIAAAALAEPSRLGERLSALLDGRRRRAVLSARWAVPAILAAGVVAGFVAAAEPGRRDAAPPTPLLAVVDEPGTIGGPPPPSANARVGLQRRSARRTQVRPVPTPAPAAVPRAAKGEIHRPARVDRVAWYGAPAIDVVLVRNDDGTIRAADSGTPAHDPESCDDGEKEETPRAGGGTPSPAPRVDPAQIAARPTSEIATP